MKKKAMDCLRLDPLQELCPAFDSCGIKLFADDNAADPDKQVLDNFAQEHIQ